MANEPRAPGLIQRYREELQTRHYARRTVKTHEQWLRRFLRFHGMCHPREMGSAEVNAFLSHLASEAEVRAVRERLEGVAALVVGASVWQRVAAHGGPEAAREGSGLRTA
jgi:hypothetical protein